MLVLVGIAAADVTENLSVNAPAGDFWTYTVESNEWVSFTVSVSSSVNVYLMPSGELANFENKDIIGAAFSPTTSDEGTTSASRSKVTISKDITYLLLVDNKAGSEAATGSVALTTPGGPGGASGFSFMLLAVPALAFLAAFGLLRRRAPRA
jgi:hypothetical protein